MAYTTINKSTDYFNTKLYTGNNVTQAITGVGFQPDFTWIKSRTSTHNNQTFDVIKGVQKSVVVNESSAEITMTNGLTAFNSDGFTLGSDDQVNNSSQNYASWNWKANGSGSANTDGSINSTVSVNTTAGFSIVKYLGNSTAGATVGHGLGVVPEVIIIKQTTGSTNWTVYHKGLGSHTKYLYLDATNAVATDSGNFDNVPTSSTFLVGSNSGVNASSGSTYIAYCFAPKTGYSKFGSYVGNGNADGTFVYTGFKPAFVIQKNSGYTGNWILYDNKRDVDNVADKILIPNSSSAEASACDVDLLSNGFKFRAVNNASSNWDGNTYIYMAFAEAPLVGSNGVTAKAR